jgi:hypothetical protein
MHSSEKERSRCKSEGIHQIHTELFLKMGKNASANRLRVYLMGPWCNSSTLSKRDPVEL